jgi:hypothetical protein
MGVPIQAFHSILRRPRDESAAGRSLIKATPPLVGIQKETAEGTEKADPGHLALAHASTVGFCDALQTPSTEVHMRQHHGTGHCNMCVCARVYKALTVRGWIPSGVLICYTPNPIIRTMLLLLLLSI